MEKLTEFMMKEQGLVYLRLNKVEQFEKLAHKDNEWKCNISKLPAELQSCQGI